MRLNKFIAESGIASRRKADELIRNGLVKINGTVCENLGTIIDENKDSIEVENKPISLVTQRIIYLLNKPRGVVTTASDPEHRQTVMDFVPDSPRVFPCGRLDVDTMGLVVLTNDGNLCYQLTHPRFEHQKEYRVIGRSKEPQRSWERLQKPLNLNDGPIMIDSIKLHKISSDKIDFWITIHDGRNRIVRRTCAAVGIEVEKLTRTKLGQYELGSIEPGQYITVK